MWGLGNVETSEQAERQRRVVTGERHALGLLPDKGSLTHLELSLNSVLSPVNSVSPMPLEHLEGARPFWEGGREIGW